MKDEAASYERARKDNLRAAGTIRVFGVPLGARPAESHQPILFCGLSVEGAEHREATRRIWHLQSTDILATGPVEGFAVEAGRVHWYDLKRESTPIEESYTPVSLAYSARLFLGGRFGGLFGGFGGVVGDVPVTLDPTAGPTGTKPPTTIHP